MSPSPFKSSVAAALWGLGLAAFLGLSGVLGAVMFDGDRGTEPVPLSSDSSSVILGRLAQARNLSIALETTESGKALLLQDVDIPAHSLPVVSYSLEFPGFLDTLLVWERSDGAGKVHHKLLPPGNGAISLAEEAEWTGRISRFGLLVRPATDPMPDIPAGSRVIEGSLRLEPNGLLQTVRVHITYWLTHGSWTGASINHLGQSRLPVILLLWTLAGALLAGLLHNPARWRATGLTLAAGVGIGWMTLHLLWLEDLRHRVAESHQRYAGRDFDSALARGPDHELVALVRRLQEAIDAGNGDHHIALVSEERFFGERGRYLLLPHPAIHLRTLGQLRALIPQLGRGDVVLAEDSLVSDVTRTLDGADMTFQRVVSSPRGTAYLITKAGQADADASDQ